MQDAIESILGVTLNDFQLRMLNRPIKTKRGLQYVNDIYHDSSMYNSIVLAELRAYSERENSNLDITGLIVLIKGLAL